ncbi:hypothetical protein AC578_10153 [Pseudocercospora eumusae]|uniref:Kinesin-like protein n=1 Tax=Pseudocercospora eumusae TaxID=321146 RepID=A0A139HYR0_9PEZI|nr:hypothetical protein AC578_10153 [Pseudocercospora eumusae]
MDAFYLNNAKLYQDLVASFDPTRPAAHFSRHTAKPTRAIPDAPAPTLDHVDENMSTIARIRPMLEDELATGFPCAIFPRQDESQILDLHDLYHHPLKRPYLKSYKYQVDKAFGSDSSTEQIYTDVVAPLVQFAQQGGIGTLFAYGQTGSGKTYTISQIQELVASTLLDQQNSQEIQITIFDLAGNIAHDLLNAQKRFSILEDEAGNTVLAGASEHTVASRDEMLALLAEAVVYRRTAPTLKNDASSRSHSICRIRIPRSCGTLYLIDLAGSEAARDIAEHGAERMRETKEINVSLSVLKDCIRGKAEGKTFIPVRGSMLTKVLKHVFEPRGERVCKTAVIACVNPCLADVGASRNTLRYAETLRVRRQ